MGCCKDCTEREVGCHAVCVQYRLEVLTYRVFNVDTDRVKNTDRGVREAKQDFYRRRRRNHR